MDSEDDIESALRQAFFAAVPDAQGKTVLINQTFDPRNRPHYYAFHFLPNTPEVATLGAGGSDMFSGVLQIDYFLGLNKGKDGLKQLSDALRSAFTAGARFNYSSARVIIKSCGRNGSGQKVDGFFRFPFVIVWESRLARN